MGFNYNRW